MAARMRARAVGELDADGEPDAEAALKGLGRGEELETVRAECGARRCEPDREDVEVDVAGVDAFDGLPGASGSVRLLALS